MGAGDPGSVETDVERLGDRRPADAEIDDVKATGSSGGGRENVRRKRHLLVASSCILGTELCERLAFVGLATNLALYLVRYMDYSAARASQMLQIWKGMVFTTPLIGAYLADAYLGRFRTILLFSAVYMAGLAGITGVNLSPTLQPRRGQPPPSGEYGPTIAAFWAFMYLIALGSGGIKPCVGSFGADNFDEQRPIERRWRSTYFIWYYCSINLGGLIAALAITPIQEAKGYGIGFAIPTVFFGAAVATLIVGASFKLYRFVPPEGSPLKRVFLVLKCALVTNRGLPRPGAGTELYDPPPGAGGLEYRMARTPRYPWLDRAALLHGRPELRQPTLTEVEETKALMGLGPILVVTALFMCFRDPVSTLLPLTGDTMDRRIGGRGERVPAASLSFANPAGMLLSVMIYDALVAPAFARMGRPITPMQRLGAGIFLQVFALLAAGFLEIARYKAVADTGLLATFDAAKASDPTLNPGRGPYFVPISVWWQVVPYFLEGISETLAFAAATEIVYTQVSEGTRSLSSSILLLGIAVGAYLSGAVNQAVSAATGADPWLASNALTGHYDWYMFLNAGLLAGTWVLFHFWIARNYVERAVVPREGSQSQVNLKTSMLVESKTEAEGSEEHFRAVSSKSSASAPARPTGSR